MIDYVENLKREAWENGVDSLQEMAAIRVRLKRKLRKAGVKIPHLISYPTLVEMEKLLENESRS